MNVRHLLNINYYLTAFRWYNNHIMKHLSHQQGKALLQRIKTAWCYSHSTSRSPSEHYLETLTSAWKLFWWMVPITVIRWQHLFGTWQSPRRLT